MQSMSSDPEKSDQITLIFHNSQGPLVPQITLLAFLRAFDAPPPGNPCRFCG